MPRPEPIGLAIPPGVDKQKLWDVIKLGQSVRESAPPWQPTETKNLLEYIVGPPLNAQLWSKQREIVESVQTHPRTAVHSAHSTGKSFLASRLVCAWLGTHAVGDAFVVTTATTGAQVRAVLWREINKAVRQAHLPGRLNQTEWWLGGELVAMGRKPADYAEATAFQGIHAPYVLVILDEAAGIPEPIWEAAESLVSNEFGRMLAIGNPDDSASIFARVCRPDSLWNVIHIDGLESPNFTEEKETLSERVQASLLSPRWAEEKKVEWGENSPLYQCRIRGNFPLEAPDTLIPLGWVLKCQAQEPQEGQQTPIELGVDVGAGGDLTVIRERRGWLAGRTWKAQTPDPGEAAGMVLQALWESKATKVKIDSIGIGWGIAGRLRELQEEGKHHAEIVAVNVSESSTDKERFPRLRDQLWWEVGRELSRNSAWNLSKIDDDTLMQLTSPRYSIDTSGRVKVEPKEDTKRRLGRSPDDADALLLAFYTPPVDDWTWQAY